MKILMKSLVLAGAFVFTTIVGGQMTEAAGHGNGQAPSKVKVQAKDEIKKKKGNSQAAEHASEQAKIHASENAAVHAAVKNNAEPTMDEERRHTVAGRTERKAYDDAGAEDSENVIINEDGLTKTNRSWENKVRSQAAEHASVQAKLHASPNAAVHAVAEELVKDGKNATKEAPDTIVETVHDDNGTIHGEQQKQAIENDSVDVENPTNQPIVIEVDEEITPAAEETDLNKAQDEVAEIDQNRDYEIETDQNQQLETVMKQVWENKVRAKAYEHASETAKIHAGANAAVHATIENGDRPKMTESEQFDLWRIDFIGLPTIKIPEIMITIK